MTKDNASDQALDQLIRQAMAQEARDLGTADLASRIALDAAAGPQQVPANTRQVARQGSFGWLPRPNWLIWPSAAALAASAAIGFFAGAGTLPFADYLPFQDPLATIDQQFASLTGSVDSGFGGIGTEDQS
ncbi:MAG: hypothetical protein KI792_13040 [Alphaproteobacteria bacterium]|nr:hypothetical protein [Alphaproteobacteria bacterium SS10]